MPPPPFPTSQLIEAVCDARERTIDLIADLTDEQLIGPSLAIINPLLWEIGHVSWFQEKWVLRHAEGRPPIRADGDTLYDSAAVAHDTRWDLRLPSREETLAYMRAVRDAVVERLRAGPLTPDRTYLTLLSVFHEDMHTEAFTYTRQTLGYPAPLLSLIPAAGGKEPRSPARGDARLSGGTFVLGASHDAPFVFDNEKWAHPVEIGPFGIARTAVTQGEFAAFVDAGGYRRAEFWSDEGWRWRAAEGAEHPVYWRHEGSGWQRRHFDRWVELEPELPVLHVSWYEAETYCRWAGRRLPTEAEWEMAASWDPATGCKRRFPWGDEPPAPERANLNWRWGQSAAEAATLPVDALPAGDSPSGCRQMIGNVWEWTVSDFLPYPGFVVDPYREYSEPWFGTHKVLRGGCWTTRSRLIRNSWRNFYRPERRDVWAGFRTCAL